MGIFLGIYFSTVGKTVPSIQMKPLRFNLIFPLVAAPIFYTLHLESYALQSIRLWKGSLEKGPRTILKGLGSR